MAKNRFITGYSGLRALAVVGVILYHLNPNVFMGGYLGVPIFFVLSGYLVTDHMLASYEERNYYNNRLFYLKRVKKIYPQLITVLWISAAWIILFQRNLLAKLWQIVLTNLLGIYNFWQIANGQSYFARFAGNESPFVHLWTMSIDIQFYLFWPLIIFLLMTFVKRKKIIFWIIFAATILSAIEMAVLYHPGVDTSRIYYGTDTRFFSLGLGALLAFIWPIRDLRLTIAPADTRILDITGLVSLLLMLWLLCSQWMNPVTAFPYLGGIFLFSVFTTILVAVIAHPGSHWNQILTNPLFNWIGSRSYGIYLYQFPVMIFFEDKVSDMADHAAFYHLTEVVIILILSEVTYRLVERPWGKINSAQLSSYWTSLKTGKASKMRKGLAAVAGIVLLLGSIGIIVSPAIKGQNFNNSKLARQIKHNRLLQKAENAKLFGHMKREKKTGKSKAVKAAEKAAHKHPVNRKFEKYHISQVQLQLAKQVKVTALGDSVMAGASDNLKKIMPNAIIDAAVSRQLDAIYPLIDSYQRKHALADNVLIGLGTNGPFSSSDLDKIMHKLGKKRHVFWINTYVPDKPWQNQVNKLLASSVKRYHNLTVINWHDEVQKHPNWLYQDHTHPNPKGSMYYSAFIAKQIVKHSQF